MGCTPAPACKAARAQATQLYPMRSQASDGICASPQHTAQNPTSDHETGEAVDITHDPAHGCDCNVLVTRVIARRDPRIKYVIWNRTIWRSYDKPGLPAWTPQRYTGSNPHTKHAHFSIKREARNDTSPWWTRTQEDQDDMYSDADRDRDERAAALVTRMEAIVAKLDDNQNLRVTGLKNDLIAAMRAESEGVVSAVKAIRDSVMVALRKQTWWDKSKDDGAPQG